MEMLSTTRRCLVSSTRLCLAQLLYFLALNFYSGNVAVQFCSWTSEGFCRSKLPSNTRTTRRCLALPPCYKALNFYLGRLVLHTCSWNNDGFHTSKLFSTSRITKECTALLLCCQDPTYSPNAIRRFCSSVVYFGSGDLGQGFGSHFSYNNQLRNANLKMVTNQRRCIWGFKCSNLCMQIVCLLLIHIKWEPWFLTTGLFLQMNSRSPQLMNQLPPNPRITTCPSCQRITLIQSSTEQLTTNIFVLIQSGIIIGVDSRSTTRRRAGRRTRTPDVFLVYWAGDDHQKFIVTVTADQFTPCVCMTLCGNTGRIVDLRGFLDGLV